MPLSRTELEKLVTDAFPGAHFEITDLAGDNDHWALSISSPLFKGKTRVQQHKMVYDALQGKMGGVLHALQLKTSIPQE